MRLPAIPSDEFKGLVLLASLGTDEVAALESALRSTPVVIDRQAFGERIPSVSGVESVDVQSIVGALMYLHGFLAISDIDESEFVDAVCSSVEDGGAEKPVVEKLAGSLPRFLSIESLRLRAKVVDLQVDHARPLQSARVITDARPIFSIREDSPNAIEGILVFHTLKLRYFQDEGIREVYITLDDRDVWNLGAVLERAEAKAAALRVLIKDKCGLQDFAESDSED